jgi:hypothetical protein
MQNIRNHNHKIDDKLAKIAARIRKYESMMSHVSDKRRDPGGGAIDIFKKTGAEKIGILDSHYVVKKNGKWFEVHYKQSDWNTPVLEPIMRRSR